MSESRFKLLDNEEFFSRIAEHSLSAGPLSYQQSLLGKLFPLFKITSISFSALSLDVAYNNSQTVPPLWQSFIVADLQTCNISAAEARLMNEPLEVA